MVQWCECLPPTNVAWVQFPDLASCGLSLLLVLVLAPRVFFLRVLQFFLPSSKTNTSNTSNLIWKQWKLRATSYWWIFTEICIYLFILLLINFIILKKRSLFSHFANIFGFHSTININFRRVKIFNCNFFFCRTNPLGMKGHIARRYGDLAQDLWSGSSRSLAPLKLRVSPSMHKESLQSTENYMYYTCTCLNCMFSWFNKCVGCIVDFH